MKLTISLRKIVLSIRLEGNMSVFDESSDRRILASHFPCTHFRFRPLGCTCHPVYDGVRRGRRRRRGFFLPSFLPTLFPFHPQQANLPLIKLASRFTLSDCKRFFFKKIKLKVQNQTMVWFFFRLPGPFALYKYSAT